MDTRYHNQHLYNEYRRLSSRRDYQSALNCLIQLTSKDSGDYRNITSTCHQIANAHFNANNYSDAAKFYIEGINYLQKYIQLEDQDYRNITELYIDLSDALLHLYQKMESDDAFRNAIKAFNCIKLKTHEELCLINARDNFKSFRSYFEKKLSTPFYLKSRKFKDHETILFNQHEENDLQHLLGNLSVSTKKSEEEKLVGMLNNLSVENQPSFSSIQIQYHTNDEYLRNMAQNLIELAQSHYGNKLIKDAISTGEHAIAAYSQIKEKNESDNQTILMLNEQIKTMRSCAHSVLTQQPDKQSPSFNRNQLSVNQQSSTPAVSTLGMFGPPSQQTNPSYTNTSLSQQTNPSHTQEYFLRY